MIDEVGQYIGSDGSLMLNLQTIVDAAVAHGAKLTLFFLYGAEVAAGELAVMFILGLPLMRWLPRSKFFPPLKAKLDNAD